MVKQIRKSYQSDLSAKEWQMVEPHIPKPKTKRGRKRAHTLREIMNAIFYVVHSGCVWNLLPHDFPSWKNVYHYFRPWRLGGIWERIIIALRTELRVAIGGLGSYQLKEALEIQEVGETTRPARVSSLKAFESTYLDSLNKTINAKDWNAFQTAYNNTVNGCNSSHTTSGFPYIKYTLPPSPPDLP